MFPPKSVQGYINELEEKLDKEAGNRGEIKRLTEENKQLRKEINELLRGKK